MYVDHSSDRAGEGTLAQPPVQAGEASAPNQRRLHAELLALVGRTTPSSASFTCLGSENCRAYSCLQLSHDTGRFVLRQWYSRLADAPLSAHGVEMSARLKEAAIERASVLICPLQSFGRNHGFLGLQRSSNEPRFSKAERGYLESLLPAMSLMADLWLSYENVMCENAVLRALGPKEGLVLIVEPDAGHVLWARHPGQKLDWGRDVRPLASAALEQLQRKSRSTTASRMGRESEVNALLSAAPVQVAELAAKPCLAISVNPLQRKELTQPLSLRERQVAELLIQGYTNMNIAAHLEVSENTVRTYVRRLYRKLGVYNRLQLVRATSMSAALASDP